MNDRSWEAIDQYFSSALGTSDPVLDGALERSRRAGLPPIQVSPNQGRLLWLLARAIGARMVLEIGTLGGYSAIWLARALPSVGRLVTLEVDPRHAAVARANLAEAGLGRIAEVLEGDATESLRRLHAQGATPFDLIFIDANKDAYDTYLELALRLAHPGTVLVADNVVRGGAVADPGSRDPDVQGVRRFATLLGSLHDVDATAIQTVGVKGYDGFVVALVTGPAR
ncbi:MAG: O-methyltransferase [Candidatus Dormibacteraeota bacterium]|nr:O-methyltransferase [Candidatus Dormibacteraeota bacterium]